MARGTVTVAVIVESVIRAFGISLAGFGTVTLASGPVIETDIIKVGVDMDGHEVMVHVLAIILLGSIIRAIAGIIRAGIRVMPASGDGRAEPAVMAMAPVGITIETNSVILANAREARIAIRGHSGTVPNDIASVVQATVRAKPS